MLKILSGTIIVLITIFLIIIGIGRSVSPEFSTVETRVFDDGVEDVWEVLTNISQYPKRKKNVLNIEIFDRDGKFIKKWKENLKFGGYRIYEIKEKHSPSRLVLEMTEPKTNLRGVWTYTLQENKNNTSVTIEQESQQQNVFWRGVSVFKGRNYFIKYEFKWLQVTLFQKLLHS